MAEGRVLEIQTMLVCCKTESKEKTKANPWPASPTEICTENTLSIAVSSFKVVVLSDIATGIIANSEGHLEMSSVCDILKS